MFYKSRDRSEDAGCIGKARCNATHITKPATVRAASSAATHCGLRRRNNQDAILDRPDIDLWAVADGVGGFGGGEKASRTVIEVLERFEPSEDYGDDIAKLLVTANRELRLQAVVDGTGTIASTVVALVTNRSQQRFTCLWVGDSRLYRLRGRDLLQITEDHTPLQEIGLGAKLSNPKLQNALSRAIGSEEALDVGRVDGAIEPGDIFLLCTDGLSKPVNARQISLLLSTGTTALAAQDLVDAALAAGGPDNVSVIVVSFPNAARGAGRWRWTRKIGKKRPFLKPKSVRRRVIALCLLVLVALAAIATQRPALSFAQAEKALAETAYRWLRAALTTRVPGDGQH
ncbi:PP2C family protein-serine/threonine phosphatase [Rhizobium sp. ZK1]|uniref:PP2C family protein-serine/threonine phosphatase n=1 Tax=Rhizobium sp. ZK1 TaxID=3389872 RepID=UPI0039F68B0B